MPIDLSAETKRLEQVQASLQAEINLVAEKAGVASPTFAPITDGVENIPGYLGSNPKVMWILKEAWGDEEADGTISGGGYSIYDSWNQTAIGIRTWDVMMYVIYGIRQSKNRVEYRDMPKANDKMLDLLKECAYINVNKMPGHHRSGNLQETYNLWRDIVHRQIDAYDPDIIIFGGTFDMMKKEGDNLMTGLRFLENTPSNVVGLYESKEGRLLLNAMHPAQTRIGREWYVDEIVDAIRKHRPE